MPDRRQAMRGTAKRLIETQAPAVPDGGDALYDYRFRRLAPRAAWDALPQDVRRRFSKRLTGSTVATYHGEIVWTRSEEHTSELQSLMRISYAVFCLKKKKKNHTATTQN